MIVRVKRQDNASSESYYQEFEYRGSGRDTVSHILEQINSEEDLRDVTGRTASKIRWECSCMQKMCGACAMVINGKPALACSEFIDADETSVLVLEPLRKFPVVTDLIVDRSCITEHQKQAMMYLGERGKTNLKEHEQQYSAAKCLKCGLCLEVCPNYVGPEGNFYGAVLANEAYLLTSSRKDRRKELVKEYRKHFAAGCSKSLACREICPAEIQTLSSIGYMNRK
jgi:succinate dehydrogenase / fumarate reductase iron-sulfur subunit